MGANWSTSGAWYTDGRAVTDLDGADRATEKPFACGDCSVSASLRGYGVPELGVFVRAPSTTSNERYDAVLLADKNVQIRRVRTGGTTVLGTGASGIADLGT